MAITNAVGINSGVVWKTVQENVSNSSTLQNDDHLLFPLVENSTYFVSLRLIIGNGGASTNIRIGCAVPAGASCELYTDISHPYLSTSLSSTALQNLTDIKDTNPRDFAIDASPDYQYRFHLLLLRVKTASTAGIFQLKWAQPSPTAGAISIIAGSSLSWEKS